MEVTVELKNKAVQAIKADRANFPSDSKHAISLGINKAVYSQIVKGQIDKKLSDSAWISIARKLNVHIGDRATWVAANTPVYKYIYSQLRLCKEESTTGLFCDKAGIGKTFTAKEFCKQNRNAVYVDCSEHSTKYSFVRALAKGFGLDNTGKLREVVADLVYYIKTLDRPLIILDEAGDLDNLTWRELKSLFNMLEDCVGWYMMGADGLRARIERNITCKTVGFAELFDRLGAEYQYITPKTQADFAAFNRHQAELILSANLPGFKDSAALLNRCQLSLRRLKKEVIKVKKSA